MTLTDIKNRKNVCVVSTRTLETTRAANGFFLIMFVMFLLLSLSNLFNADAQKLVVGPIENMVRKISEMMRDPLGLNKLIDPKAEDPKAHIKKPTFLQKTFNVWPCKKPDPNAAPEEAYETRMLKSTIDRIQELLRVGFGSAGGEIVAKNLKAAIEKGETPKVASKFGLRVYGVWGFCIIEDFNEILVAMDEDVFAFVNTIAKMVHTEMLGNKGAVNKNIGEAFLLTFKTKPNKDPVTGFDELAFVKGEIPDVDTGKFIDDGTKEYYLEEVECDGGQFKPRWQTEKCGLDQREAADCALAACKALPKRWTQKSTTTFHRSFRLHATSKASCGTLRAPHCCRCCALILC